MLKGRHGGILVDIVTYNLSLFTCARQGEEPALGGIAGLFRQFCAPYSTLVAGAWGSHKFLCLAQP